MRGAPTNFYRHYPEASVFYIRNTNYREKLKNISSEEGCSAAEREVLQLH